MAVSAGAVKQLREMTGAGMMDCKKALTETDGDLDAAVEYLRKHGQMKAEKKASRIAAEGLCAVLIEGDKSGVVVEVNSETDFVAKNDDFKGFVENVARHVLGSKAPDVEVLLLEKFAADESKTIHEALIEKIAVIGEKLSIRRFEKMEAPDGMVVPYVHGGGRIGVLVKAKTENTGDEVKTALINVAMQIAAMNPKYVSTADVSEEFKAKEREILLEQAINENLQLPENQRKPEAIIQKMLEGRLNKQLKESCLLSQVYVRDPEGKQTVEAYLKDVSKTAGSPVSVVGFVRYETGEGIEKKQENFAEEVAKQMGA